MTKNDLRIVFFGTPDFAVESLDALVKNGFNVAAVVTMPDKAAGRGQKVQFSAVKKYALEHGLPLLQPAKLKDPEFVDALRAIGADLFIVIAFRMLPEVVWGMPPLGTFNLHGSLLPLYRGAAPINRAIMNGDSTTGVTTFFLRHEIDTGDIIDRVSIEVGPDEDAGSVHDRLMAIGAKLTVDTVEHIIAGDLHTTPQSELCQGIEPTPAPKIFKDDCLIDWTLSAQRIHNHVRGLAPYPAAWSRLRIEGQPESTIKILRTARTDAAVEGTPGQLVASGKKVYAVCGQGEALELVSVQPAGRKAMPAPDFLRGLRGAQAVLF
ncbi:MAG: methionyl-tRNA formyltransferase [Muribaculaceae bacterium]|nr:methionyl-tRNA formyltransferase [Muribaculaceae bacterium]